MCRALGGDSWALHDKAGGSARFPSRLTVYTVFTVFFAVTRVDNLFKL